ncbi:hypothetical protein GOARA_043_00270 [Gordonia araii NBRC 100433]|uniref:Uncharacterized protein n=1 Tax=Gordonia araii NBRC 100433 TaxID=1073574 RepID=G7H192_9ACTN|nr:hypothetical protein [Gordonia araii]NNG96760.1 hypothetical protein [Gordonia araii NBRC 100433]GAB09552.1 hypothetical protein GOARA_043_00270 [Gordonia araii NBRC 100433]
MTTNIGRKTAAVAALAASAAIGMGALGAGVAAAEPRVGAPCTNQDGAPGYYIWENPDKTAYHNNLICNITGDAPRARPRPDPNPFGS